MWSWKEVIGKRKVAGLAAPGGPHPCGYFASHSAAILAASAGVP
jgi:hypothetical protein